MAKTLGVFSFHGHWTNLGKPPSFLWASFRRHLGRHTSIHVLLLLAGDFFFLLRRVFSERLPLCEGRNSCPKDGLARVVASAMDGRCAARRQKKMRRSPGGWVICTRVFLHVPLCMYSINVTLANVMGHTF
jgi:hypothetical protein